MSPSFFISSIVLVIEIPRSKLGTWGISSLSVFHNFKIIFRAHLTAFANNFLSVRRRFRCQRFAQRRARRQRLDHFERFDSERPRGETRSVTASDAKAPNICLRG